MNKRVCVCLCKYARVCRKRSVCIPHQTGYYIQHTTEANTKQQLRVQVQGQVLVQRTSTTNHEQAGGWRDVVHVSLCIPGPHDYIRKGFVDEERCLTSANAALDDERRRQILNSCTKKCVHHIFFHRITPAVSGVVCCFERQHCP